MIQAMKGLRRRRSRRNGYRSAFYGTDFDARCLRRVRDASGVLGASESGGFNFAQTIRGTVVIGFLEALLSLDE